MTDCAIGSGAGKNGRMPPKPKFTEDLFVRMPAGTKARLERLAGQAPVPAAYLRDLLLNAIEAEEARRGLPPITPPEADKPS